MRETGNSVSSMTSWRSAAVSVEAEAGEDVCDLEQVHEVWLAGFAELLTVALGGDVVGATDHPGVFGGAILAELGEELFQAGVELALGAVAVEAEGYIARSHGLVYDSHRDAVARRRIQEGGLCNGRGVLGS